MFRFTPVVRNLIFINVIVFVLQNMIPRVTELLALYNVQTNNFKPYQLFTYMFCHGSLGHIFGNMLMLIVSGPIVEEYWGARKFVVFYTICGVGAGLFNVIIDMFGGYPTQLIGASGAVYGVVTAFGILFPNMELRLMFLPISFRAIHFAMFMGALAIYNAVQPTSDGVAHLAHLGGIVVAIIMIQIWRKTGG